MHCKQAEATDNRSRLHSDIRSPLLSMMLHYQHICRLLIPDSLFKSSGHVTMRSSHAAGSLVHISTLRKPSEILTPVIKMFLIITGQLASSKIMQIQSQSLVKRTAVITSVWHANILKKAFKCCVRQT